MESLYRTAHATITGSLSPDLPNISGYFTRKCKRNFSRNQITNKAASYALPAHVLKKLAVRRISVTLSNC